MKNELVLAIGALAAEKNLPQDTVFRAVEDALASAYRRDGDNARNVVVKIDPGTGDINAFLQREVVDEIDPDGEEGQMALAEAKKYKPDAAVGDILDFQMKLPEQAGRIAAQTAKQVVLQRLREAERASVYDEYAEREGDIVLATVQRVESRQATVEIGRGTEAIMPSREMVRSEHLRPGQRVRVLVLKVQKEARGPQVIASRSHADFLRRLFEMEVPEIKDGRVEIVSIAREPGFRSKIAVFSRHSNVDPIGACVGMRAARIQNIVNELNGERVDIVLWDADPARFVGNALSPAEVVQVDIDEEARQATVYVPNRMLSLAIGREGQNARLAAKLTGWRVTIHSEAALERVDAPVIEAPSTFEPFGPGEEPPEIKIPQLETPAPRVAAPAAPAPVPVAEVAVAPSVELEVPVEEAAALVEPVVEEPVVESEERFEDQLAGYDDYEEFEDEEYEVPEGYDEPGGPGSIRFAEDVLPGRDPEDGGKKKKKTRAPRFVDALEEDLEEIDYSGRIH